MRSRLKILFPYANDCLQLFNFIMQCFGALLADTGVVLAAAFLIGVKATADFEGVTRRILA